MQCEWVLSLTFIIWQSAFVHTFLYLQFLSFGFWLSCEILFVPLPEACGSIAVYQGPQEHSEYHFTIDDSVETFKTLQHIKSIVEKLNEPHEKYKKYCTSAKYGSQ